MSGVVKAVSNAIGSVVKGVGKVVSSIGKTVVNTVKGALSNPIGTIAKVAAISTGQLWALPIIDGAQVLANGGSLGDALKTGAISAASTWVMSPTGGNLAGTFSSALGNETLGSVAANALRGGTTSALTGGNFAEGALQGGLQAGVAGGVNALGVNDWIKNSALGAGLGATGAQIATNALTGGLKSALTGGDVGAGITGGVTGSLFNQAGQGLSNLNRTVSSWFNSDNEALKESATAMAMTQDEGAKAYQEYNDLSNSYEATVKPLYDEVMTHKNALDTNADLYNQTSEEINELVKNYNDAEARGDTAEMERISALYDAKSEELDKIYGAYEKANADLEASYAKYETTNSDIQNRANELRSVVENTDEKMAQLQAEGQAREDQANLEAFQNASAGQGIFDTASNEQIFDDGSSITTFDDGTSIVKDADGTMFSYDANGQLFTADNKLAPQGTAPKGEANAWAKTLQGFAKAGAGIGASMIGGGMHAPTGQGTSTVGGAMGANALANQESDEATPTIISNQQPSEDFDLFGFLKGGSKLTYIPGVTDVLGFKPENTEYLNYTGGTQTPLGSSDNSESVPPSIYDIDFNNTNTTDTADQDMNNNYLDYGGQYVDSDYAEGGHVPEFYSEGGASYVGTRDGDGTQDKVPAMLSSNEYVIPAQVVSMLGNGSPDKGAGVLDQFVRAIREHKRSHNSDELEPDSLGPLGYLQQAMKGA